MWQSVTPVSHHPKSENHVIPKPWLHATVSWHWCFMVSLSTYFGFVNGGEHSSGFHHVLCSTAAPLDVARVSPAHKCHVRTVEPFYKDKSKFKQLSFFFLHCLVGCLSTVVWTHAALGVLHACVLSFLHLYLFSATEHVSHGKVL